jgi:DnaJ-class molecular chaperone
MKCTKCNGGGGGRGWMNKCESCDGLGYIKQYSHYDVQRLIDMSKRLADNPNDDWARREVRELTNRLG